MNNTELDNLLQNNILIIYDGICGFCNKTIQIILNNRPSEKLKFVSFQSELGKQIIKTLDILENMDSIIVIENSTIFIKSTAIFTLLKYIESPFKNLYYFNFLPSFITDFVYAIIARNRYFLMGKTNQCRILTKEEKSFFIG